MTENTTGERYCSICGLVQCEHLLSGVTAGPFVVHTTYECPICGASPTEPCEHRPVTTTNANGEDPITWWSPDPESSNTLIIDSNGDVGIGVVPPSEPLRVREEPVRINDGPKYNCMVHGDIGGDTICISTDGHDKVFCLRCIVRMLENNRCGCLREITDEERDSTDFEL